MDGLAQLGAGVSRDVDVVPGGWKLSVAPVKLSFIREKNSTMPKWLTDFWISEGGQTTAM